MQQRWRLDGIDQATCCVTPRKIGVAAEKSDIPRCIIIRERNGLAACVTGERAAPILVDVLETFRLGRDRQPCRDLVRRVVPGRELLHRGPVDLRKAFRILGAEMVELSTRSSLLQVS